MSNSNVLHINIRQALSCPRARNLYPRDHESYYVGRGFPVLHGYTFSFSYRCGCREEFWKLVKILTALLESGGGLSVTDLSWYCVKKMKSEHQFLRFRCAKQGLLQVSMFFLNIVNMRCFHFTGPQDKKSIIIPFEQQSITILNTKCH